MNGTDRNAPPAPTMLEMRPMPPPTANEPALAREARAWAWACGRAGCWSPPTATNTPKNADSSAVDMPPTICGPTSEPTMMPGASPATTDHRIAPMPVMLAHRRDRREQDRRRRRRDRHVHDVLGRETLPREDERQQRHHRHAAAEAEQPGEEADDRAQDEERADQRRIHSVPPGRAATCVSAGAFTACLGELQHATPTRRDRPA